VAGYGALWKYSAGRDRAKDAEVVWQAWNLGLAWGILFAICADNLTTLNSTC